MADIEDAPQRPYRFEDTIEVFDKCTSLITELRQTNLTSKEEFNDFFRRSQSKYGLSCSITSVLYVYRVLKKRDPTLENSNCERYLRGISSRASSGVMVITVLTSPWPSYVEGTALPPENSTAFVKTDQENLLARKHKTFSCKHDCFYCPQEPGMPRSYLKMEPAVSRASKNGFDAVKQFSKRANTYWLNGMMPDKIELLVLGGTWSSYPEEYQDEFIRDLYYAANTFSFEKRARRRLEEEIRLNETSNCRIIGLTLETRPDSITLTELKRFRRFGVTRVQLGVQHIRDDILKYINRGCYLADTIRALRLLKNNCFKVDIHLMPDLPGSSPEIDRDMFERVLNDEQLQADQWKIYPCTVTKWSKIEKWYLNDKENRPIDPNASAIDNRRYRPYAEQVFVSRTVSRGGRRTPRKTVYSSPLTDLLIDVKAQVHPYIRLNRIVRDIPGLYVKHSFYKENLRSIIHQEMRRRKLTCSCMRCREVKNDDCDLEEMVLVCRKYRASGGQELFLSFESNDYKILYGFLRLRFSDLLEELAFPELEQTALVRELHIYGNVVPVNTVVASTHSQHRGLGKRLLKKAEELSLLAGYSRLAVIAGVGVRNYYRKLGYADSLGDGNFQIKSLSQSSESETMIILPPTKKVSLFLKKTRSLVYLIPLALLFICLMLLLCCYI